MAVTREPSAFPISSGHAMAASLLGAATKEQSPFSQQHMNSGIPAQTLTTLYSCCSQIDCADGFNPEAAMIKGNGGFLYGTTSGGVVL